MNSPAALSFFVNNIQSSLLISKVPLDFAESNSTLNTFFKIELFITADDELSVRFGVKLKAEGRDSEDINQEDTFLLIVENVGQFKFTSTLPKITKATDHPIIANIVATMYPFARERVTTLLGSSSIQYFLESFNAINFLKEYENTIPVMDIRKSAEEKAKA